MGKRFIMVHCPALISHRVPVTASLYLEVDLLGQLFSLVVLCAGVAVGGQSQEGRAHGAATRLTAEVLGPAREQVRSSCCQEHLSFYMSQC